MSGSDEEQPVTGTISILVEAAPQGLMQYTLDAVGGPQVWHSVLLAHDDAVMGKARNEVETAHLLVRGSIEYAQRDVPSLVVGGVTLDLRQGPTGNAQVASIGDARFLVSEWTAVKERDDPQLG